MRARAALAAVLWRLGRRLEAVEHQRELLRLNPRDNQRLRYRQANWLLALESYDELDQLFAAYTEDRTPVSSTRRRWRRSLVEVTTPPHVPCWARRGSSTHMCPPT